MGKFYILSIIILIIICYRNNLNVTENALKIKIRFLLLLNYVYAYVALYIGVHLSAEPTEKYLILCRFCQHIWMCMMLAYVRRGQKRLDSLELEF